MKTLYYQVKVINGERKYILGVFQFPSYELMRRRIKSEFELKKKK